MSEEALNLDEFMDRVQDDKELLFELLDIFVSDFRVKRQALGAAIEKGDFETVEHAAHFLKGSCGNISAESLRTIFSEFEEKGRKKNLEGTEGRLDDIDQKFEELVKYVGELHERLQ